MVFHRARSKTLLAPAWPVPPPSHRVGAALCPQPGLGQALQEKGHSWKGCLCLGCPAATFGWDHLSRYWLLSWCWTSPVRGCKLLLAPSWGGCAQVMHANLYANRSCLWTQKSARTHQSKYGLPQPPFFHPPKE